MSFIISRFINIIIAISPKPITIASNCGVNTTSDNDMEINGMGLFMEKISIALEKENIIVPMVGIKANDNILEIIRQLS